jgi:glycosyltransferase involved in cell wall biosynthesis
MSQNNKKIVHVITGLEDGGAEGVLYRLLKYSNSSYDYFVISLTSKGKYGDLIEGLGVKIFCLNMARGTINVSSIIKLYRLIKKNKPDVVQTWMHHADLLGGLVAYFAGVKQIYWNLRTAELHSKKTKLLTRIVVLLCSMLSYIIPTKIVSCSSRAIQVFKNAGYADKFILIPNGFDTNKFSWDEYERKKIREEWLVKKNDFVIGMVARFDPQKDHENLLNSILLLQKKIPNFKCILIGKNISQSNPDLVNMINKNNLNNIVLLFGQQMNIAKIMNGLDLHVLSSLYGEGFPNVLAESMSCGTPCIATNVGDAAEIVGELGWIVEPSDSLSLSDSIFKAYTIKKTDPDSWTFLRKKCQLKVKDKYDLRTMYKGYSSLWSNF